MARRHTGQGPLRQDHARAVEKENHWVTVAFTWNGLRALGVDEAALASLPEEFRQGMVARAEMLGDSGANDPSCWVDKTQAPICTPL